MPFYKIVNRKKRFITFIIDIFGYVLWTPISLFKKKGVISVDIMEVLIIRTAYVGDVIMTLPILKPLKELYPNSRITFLTSSSAKALFLNNPYVDEVIIYDAWWFYPDRSGMFGDYFKFLSLLQSRRYDLVIEARADIRDIALLAYLIRAKYRVSYNVGGGGYLLTHIVPFNEIKHRVDYHLDIVRYLGANIDDIEWDIYLTEEEELKADKLLAETGLDSKMPIVAIHPGGRKELKCWSPQRFAEVADSLVDRLNVSVVLTGAHDEVQLVEQVAGMMKNRPFILAGKTTLREMAVILKKCSLFICNDSSPLHIASVMKTPTVAIFGPSKSRETGPYGNSHVVVEKDFPCRYTCDEDKCNFIHYKQCMEDITVTDVVDAAYSLLSRVHG